MKSFFMVAAIATTFTASPATAAIYSGANLSNYKVSLVDLNLEDGITPSITFQPGYEYLYGYVSGANSPEPYSANDQNISPISKTSTNNINTSTTTISGNTFDTTGLQVSGSSLEQQEGVESFGYLASVNKSDYFLLSANTRVSFTLNSLNYIETANGTAGNAFAYTNSYLEVSGYNLKDQVIANFSSDDDEIYYEAATNSDSDYNFALLTMMNVVLDNNDNTELFGFFYSGANTTGTLTLPSAVPSSVPVPAALPLMATAIGVFGFSRRRKALA